MGLISTLWVPFLLVGGIAVHFAISHLHKLAPMTLLLRHRQFLDSDWYRDFFGDLISWIALIEVPALGMAWILRKTVAAAGPFKGMVGVIGESSVIPVACAVAIFCCKVAVALVRELSAVAPKEAALGHALPPKDFHFIKYYLKEKRKKKDASADWFVGLTRAAKSPFRIIYEYVVALQAAKFSTFWDRRGAVGTAAIGIARLGLSNQAVLAFYDYLEGMDRDGLLTVRIREGMPDRANEDRCVNWILSAVLKGEEYRTAISGIRVALKVDALQGQTTVGAGAVAIVVLKTGGAEDMGTMALEPAARAPAAIGEPLAATTVELERRKSVRSEPPKPSAATLRSLSRETLCCEGRLIDYSADGSGVCLNCSADLTEKTSVRLQVGECDIGAEVRYSSKTKAGLFVQDPLDRLTLLAALGVATAPLPAPV